MRTAVTGGSGVVGAALVRHLVAGGHQVRALARSQLAADKVRALGAEAVPGDVLAPESLVDLVSGADRVFHAAGINEMCSLRPDLMDQVNIDGTLNVLRACAAADVGRLVHTSSATAIGQAPGTVGDEETAHRGRYLSRYERSKHLSEQRLFSEAGDVDVVVVSPSSVQGPGRATGTGKLILDLLNGKLPFVIEAAVSVVDIDDCARGHVLAAERGRGGERYLLSGHSFGIAEVLDLLAELTGAETSTRFLPGWVATVGAAIVEAGARLARRRPPVCREMARVLRAGHIYDGTKATRDLGLVYTPLAETISRTVAWFRSEGLLG